MLVNARHLIRKMRGGAQAHLLACDDGRFYVVKFRNNPQHRRILVNEWIASVFLRYLEISSPDTAIVNLSEEFLAANPDVCLQLGSKTISPEPGWHFGSCYPGDPGRVSVYDFIPDILLQKIENLPDFLAVLAFDKWMGNADSRQSIFFRARVRQYVPASRSSPEKTGFVASMMDHGYVFDGPHWAFTESPLQGLYFRPIVYRKVRGFEDFEPWLDRIVHFPEEVVDDALKQLPPQWLNGDRMGLETILTKLMSRRRRVPDLIQDSAKGRVNLFPNWK
jgi:hypothetical protein